MLIPKFFSDILFRNQWEVHQYGPSHKHTEFQNDWSVSSRETGIDSIPPGTYFSKYLGR